MSWTLDVIAGAAGQSSAATFHSILGPLRGRRMTPQKTRSCLGLRGLLEVVDQPGKKAAPVGRAERRLDVVLRVRHQAKHIAAVVEHAGDGIGGTVEIPRRIKSTLRRGVPEQHPALAFEARDG